MVSDLLCVNHPYCFLAYKPSRLSQQRDVHNHGAFRVSCSVSTQSSNSNQLTANRRSANYKPTIWDYEQLQSLSTDRMGKKYEESAKKLEEEVKYMINNENAELLATLELIDDMQLLGLGYRFENEIKRALDRIFLWEDYQVDEENKLHVAALRFRLLRKHGYVVSQDVFKSFMDNEDKFMATLQKDVKGMLSLYEAAYLAFEGEDLLDEALTFSRTHLNELKTKIDPAMAELVCHSLELPLHHRMTRLEARWYIEASVRRKDANYPLLELAKLDFNTAQSTYREDLKEMSSWWKEIDLANKLTFARDRLMESYIFTLGMVPDPPYSNCRKALTKVASFIAIIDDIYDVYGTIDELELFTDAVERWEINAINDLPYYMKISFLALYNTVNEMAYDTLKKQEENVIPLLSKAWADLCKAFLQEAKWSYNKDTPTFEDYFENAWRSVSGSLLLVHSFFLLNQTINKEAIESLEKYHNFLRWPSTIFRLCNDFATSRAELERGEAASSILCFMHETGFPEELAREHSRNMIHKNWKKMNQDRVNDEHPFAQLFVETAFNLAQTAQCTYQHGDGYSAQDGRAKKIVLSLIVEPISLAKMNDSILIQGPRTV